MSTERLQATWRALLALGLPPASMRQIPVNNRSPWVTRSQPVGANMTQGPAIEGAAYLTECMRAGLIEQRLVRVAALAQCPAAGALYPADYALGRPTPCALEGCCLRQAGAFASHVYAAGGPQAAFALFLLILLDGSFAERPPRHRDKITTRQLSMLVDWVQAGLPLETQHFANEPTLNVRGYVAIYRFIGAAKTYVRACTAKTPTFLDTGEEWFRLLCLALRGQTCGHVVIWGRWLQEWALEAVSAGPNSGRTGPRLTEGGTYW